MTTRVVWICFAAIVLFCSTAAADTMYTYTGNHYTSIEGPAPPWTLSDSIHGYFVVADPLEPQFASLRYPLEPGFVVPLAFSFTDGVFTFTQTNSGFSLFAEIDASGNIIGWSMGLSDEGVIVNSCAVLCDTLPRDDTFIIVDGSRAVADNVMGTWTRTQTAPIPEPSTLLMFGTAAVGLVARLTSFDLCRPPLQAVQRRSTACSNFHMETHSLHPFSALSQG
jgi:hypothetical protein